MEIWKMEVMREIGKLQTNYNNLVKTKKLTKKAMCDLIIPFRDKYDLKDKDAIAIANGKLSISQILELIDK